MPRSDGLTPLARQMLTVLRERGDWMGRTALASALQYSELSNYHLKLLNRMVDKGLIEERRIRTANYVLAHEYWAKP